MTINETNKELIKFSSKDLEVDYTKDFKYCWKYLLPNIEGLKEIKLQFFNEECNGYFGKRLLVILEVRKAEDSGNYSGEAQDTNLALAFCRAVLKYIRREDGRSS